MTKKIARVSMEPSPSYPVVGEEARSSFRIQILMQDYEELLKETKEKRLKLQREKRRIQQLSAEVKFLRRKYKSLIKNPSQKIPYQLKNKSQKTPNPLKNQNQRALYLLKKHSHKPSPVFNVLPQIPEIGSELSLTDRTYREKKAAIRSTPVVLDLNQVSLPNGEEAEFQVEWEPLAMGKSSKRYPSEGQYPSGGDVAASDLNLSVCRDVGSGAIRTGKRKISWQDQVALRV